MFNRGFINELHIDVEGLIEFGMCIAGSSAMTEVRVFSNPYGGYYDDIHDEAGQPKFAEAVRVLMGMLPECRIRRLTLDNLYITDPSVFRELFTIPELGLLNEFIYDFGWVGGPILQEFAEAANLIHLKRLVLGSFGLDDEGLTAIAESPQLGRLPELLLRSDDHYDPNTGPGWGAIEKQFGDRASLDIHMEADERMYDDEGRWRCE